MSPSTIPPRLAPPAGEPLGALAGRFRAADRILQEERGTTRAIRSWPWIIGALIAGAVLDVVLHLGSGIRAGMSAIFVLALVGGASFCAWLAWGKRNSFEHVARVLESRHPRLGSRLINILQLRAQAHDSAVAPLTRQLAAGAVAGYAEDLRNEPLEQLARTDQVRVEAKRAMWWLLGFLALGVLFVDISRTEILRFADPFGDHPPYSFTQLDITDPGDDTTFVTYGGGVLVTAHSRGHRPGELFLTRFPAGHPEQSVTLPMFDKGDRGFTQQIDGITTETILVAHTKNRHSLSKQRHIGVVLTPKLEQAWVKISPPAYTGLAAREQPLQFKSLKALEGSTLTFRLQSNRPLREGAIAFEKAPGEIERVALAPASAREVRGDFVAKASGHLKFTLTDADGNPSAETWELALTVTHDLPPEVEIKNPDTDSFVALDFKVEPVVEANDDYGVKTLRIHLARNGVFVEPRVVALDKPTVHVRDGFTLDFRQMDVESGDTISYFAEAIDNAPEPHIARSKTITLSVIDTEEYNQFLREQTDLSDIEAKYTKLLNDFRDLVDQQRKLGEDIDALKKQLAAATDDKAREALQKKLDALLAKQADINEQLNQLADTMQNFVRDQPLYDIESELKSVLQEKAEQIRESTKANEQQREEIAKSQPPQDGKKSGAQSVPSQKILDDFKKASDEQVERLASAEKEAEKQIEQPLQDMSALHEIIKDINRYKELYAAQKQLAEQAKPYARQAPLNREDQLALKDLAAHEKAIGEELDAVEQKLFEDGKAAEDKFPKAGKSAQDLAQMMGDLRLQMIANNATNAMTSGNGPQGSELSEHLRSEMEKMFSQCNGKQGEMSNELDQAMKIQRSMNPKGSFKQMMQCKKFGQGQKPGSGAQGNGGKDGFVMQSGPNANVLGNESRLSESEKSKLNGNGKNKAQQNAVKPEVALDKPDVVRGMNDTNRESEAVQGETTVDQYRDIVEKYFRAITK